VEGHLFAPPPVAANHHPKHVGCFLGGIFFKLFLVRDSWKNVKLQFPAPNFLIRVTAAAPAAAADFFAKMAFDFFVFVFFLFL
jgi:hypothetical protein